MTQRRLGPKTGTDFLVIPNNHSGDFFHTVSVTQLRNQSSFKLVVGARNRTYPISIPCLKSILGPFPIPELTLEPIPKFTPEPVPKMTPDSIPESESTPESESAPELELAVEWETVLELK